MSILHGENDGDPVAKLMAQSVANAFHHPIIKTGTADHQQDETIGLEFRLHSFLTRPKATTDLYPRSSLQQQRYDRITVQERLVVLSVCERLGKEPSKVPPVIAATTMTNKEGGGGQDRQESADEAGGVPGGVTTGHETSATTTGTTNNNTATATTTTTTSLGNESPKPVLVAGLEVLEYRLYRSLGTTDQLDIDESDGNRNHSRNTQQQRQRHPQREVYEKVVYLAKVDTTGFWPPPVTTNDKSQDASSSSSTTTRAARWRATQKASPAQVLVQAYLQAMRQQEKTVALLDKKARARVSSSASSSQWLPPHHARTSLYVFARAQPQYLFAKSANNPLKRPLSDRGLVRWWKKMIEAVYNSRSRSSDRDNSSSSITNTTTTTATEAPGASLSTIVANWHIPGVDEERLALRLIQHSGDAAILLPSHLNSSNTTTTAAATSTFSWQYGPPDRLPSSGHERKPSSIPRLARDWIPCFPDDPKSRLMQSSPSCRGGQVDLRLFWELAAISEESGAGKTTGFFRVIEDFPESEEQQQQQQHSPALEEQSMRQNDDEEKPKVETTPPLIDQGDGVVELETPQQPQQPLQSHSKRGGSSSDYTQAINTLLNLNFSNPTLAVESTRKWEQKIATWIQNECVGEGNVPSSPTPPPPSPQPSILASATLPSISKSPSGSPSWIEDHLIQVEYCVPTKLPLHSAFSEALNVTPQIAGASVTTASGPPQVNILGANFVRKSGGSHGVSSSLSPTCTTPAATVNILGAGLIKRKNPPTSFTTTTAASLASTPQTPQQPSSAPTTTILPNGATVNILGAGFIKKRKTDS
ncbi:hypothetical protein DFQ27_001456 [Actinomortierella ambigua]|uniref:histone acetyltransferase n=1 Tax=Actinomortierella ambigua TaxID=1343610 RepID=A0A9P6UD06_9FUNG|nr:hypothetical protein DFQ27_001456 [Actinomortierella ambigua]